MKISGTHEIVRFIAETEFSGIPEQAVKNAKKSFLDGLGVTVAGSAQPAGRIIAEYVRGLEARPEAGVVMGGFRTCSCEAALANGTFSHALDYDDIAPIEGGVHLTATILPAVLATGQRGKSSGKDTLNAFIVGWEVGSRLGDLLDGKALPRGWHTTSVAGCLATAAAACSISGLKEDRVANALGIAASHASGLRMNFGSDTKPLHAGAAARSGVLASILAGKGFTANTHVLEGPNGLVKVFSGNDFTADSRLDMGARYYLAAPGPTIKLYASCGTSHPSISGMLALIAEHHIKAGDVAEVECRVNHAIGEMLKFTRPETLNEAKFSLQYCTAMVLLEGGVTLAQFKPEKLTSPEVRSLMEKVRVVTDIPEESIRRAPRVVKVKLKDGREYAKEVVFSEDSAGQVGWDDVCTKFRGCTEGFIDNDKIDQAIDMVSHLEDVRDINDLADIVTG